MWTTTYWKQVAERAVKAAASALLAAWVVGDVVINAFSLDWQEGLGIALGGAIVSVLMSIASNAVPVGPAGSPSLVPVESSAQTSPSTPRESRLP